MVVGIPSIQIWIDSNDSEIFKCVPVKRGIDESMPLIFQETRSSGSIVGLGEKCTSEFRFEVR